MTTNEPAGSHFRVLMVCYANVCRSPMMEAILQQLADAQALGWEVTSAGIAANSDQPMHRHASKVLRKRGIDTSRFRTQRVDGELLAGADMVLTATEATRDFVLPLHPAGLAHTFTLLHFTHLVRAAGEYDGATAFGPWLLMETRRLRSRLQPLPRESRDLADPMGHSMARFRRCARVIEEALEIILEPLPGPRWSWRELAERR